MGKLTINKKQLFNISVGLLSLCFVLFYFSDGLGKVMQRTGMGFHRHSAIVKGFFEIVVLVYSIFTLRKTKAHILIVIFLLVVCFLIGQLFLGFSFDRLDFSENFNSLFKYLFPLIFFLLATDILSFNEYPKKLFKYYKIIITINSIFIVVGFLLSIYVFKTYRGLFRFGYDGLILAQNEASFIFIFAITTVYYRRFYLNIKEVFFWIVLLPSMLVATKAVFLYIILLLFFHIFKRVGLKKIIAFGLFMLGCGYLIFSTLVNEIFVNAYQVFLYQYKKGGLLHALLSGRNSFFEEKLVPLIFEHWSVPNIIFGGQDVVSHYIEMGFIDLFLFFGVFGMILYLYIFFKLLNTLPFVKDFKLFFIISFLLIIATAGHFFESGIAGIHFIFLLLINQKKKADD